MRRPVTAPAPTSSSNNRCVASKTSGSSIRMRGQIVDVEKAAVIDFLGRHAPEREAVGLIVQQFVEPIETAGIARSAIDLGERLVDRLPAPASASSQRRSSRRLMISFSRARSAMRSGSVSLRRGRYSSAVKNALELGIEILVLEGRELFQRDLEDVAVGPGRDREFVIVIAKEKRAAFEAHPQLAALEDAPILVAQNRQENFFVQIGFERMPFDVEIRRIDRAGAVFEHVHPPLIEWLADAHVVRHEIERSGPCRARAVRRSRRRTPSREPMAALSLL